MRRCSRLKFDSWAIGSTFDSRLERVTLHGERVMVSVSRITRENGCSKRGSCRVSNRFTRDLLRFSRCFL